MKEEIKPGKCIYCGKECGEKQFSCIDCWEDLSIEEKCNEAKLRREHNES